MSIDPIAFSIFGLDTILRCLFIFFKKLENKLINIPARINGRPSPSEKIPISNTPWSKVSSWLAKSKIPDRIIPTQGTHPNEKITPMIKDPA
ncbi:unnamed protein product [marine sediment metagenome]|uniref:Uncharacterized protein n=1 Tax=marine sediment metagenome TaxID=412755 RepID=X1C241_9ZZZZ